MKYPVKRRKKYTLTPLGRVAVIALVMGAVAVSAIFLLMNKNNHDIKDTMSRYEQESQCQDNPVSSADEDISTENQVKETVVEVTLKKDGNIKLPDKIKKLITDYTRNRYLALGKLELTELGEYFDSDNKYGRMYADFNNATLDYLIYIRKNRSADLGFDKAEITVTVSDVQVYDNEYVIDYYIDEALSFNFTDDVSYSCDISVQARAIRDSEGEFLFTQVAEDTDVNLLFEEPMVKALGFDWSVYYLKELTIPDDFDSGAEIRSILKKLKISADDDIILQRESLSEYNRAPDSFEPTVTADNAYDREKAVAYSYKWVAEDKTVRNPDYTDYSDYGGNCQNYSSQCILAGGVPMDIIGDYEAQWKWYGEEANGYEEEYGRSGSWAGTEYFYEYCKNNTGYGLVAETDVNIYSAKPGDVIQYVVDGWAHHSVVVSEVIYDSEGNVAEILINSNTTDRKDYPLTAYGYTDIRLIRIVGYNN